MAVAKAFAAAQDSSHAALGNPSPPLRRVPAEGGGPDCDCRFAAVVPGPRARREGAEFLRRSRRHAVRRGNAALRRARRQDDAARRVRLRAPPRDRAPLRSRRRPLIARAASALLSSRAVTEPVALRGAPARSGLFSGPAERSEKTRAFYEDRFLTRARALFYARLA